MRDHKGIGPGETSRHLTSGAVKGTCFGRARWLSRAASVLLGAALVLGVCVVVPTVAGASPISPHHLRHFLSGRWGSWPTASKERSQRWRIPT